MIDFETLDYHEAVKIAPAIQSAIRAMASYGSDREHMETMATLLVAAERAEADAYREYQREKTWKDVA